ncbi:MAG: septum formation initiator family protein [Eubacteriales bacterium]
MKLLSKNMFVRFAALIVAVVCVTSLILLRLDNNEKKMRADALREEVEEMQNYISELEADLEKPFDEEYVAKIAHDKLGMRYPQEVIFYSEDEG